MASDPQRTPPRWRKTALAAFERLAAQLDRLAEQARAKRLKAGAMQAAMNDFFASEEMAAFNRMLVEASARKGFSLP